MPSHDGVAARYASWIRSSGAKNQLHAELNFSGIHRTGQSGYRNRLPSIALINALTSNDSFQHLHVFDLHGIDGERIVSEHDQIGEFPGFDRTFNLLVM